MSPNQFGPIIRSKNFEIFMVCTKGQTCSIRSLNTSLKISRPRPMNAKVHHIDSHRGCICCASGKSPVCSPARHGGYDPCNHATRQMPPFAVLRAGAGVPGRIPPTRLRFLNHFPYLSLSLPSSPARTLSPNLPVAVSLSLRPNSHADPPGVG
jgi:hypothetical protein